jgi:uncharacterized membrane protein
MNPYDLHSVLHAKHAQHVVLIHFPIALFLVGVAFDFLYQWTRGESLRVAARLNLILAAASTVPVLITGLLAWRWALEGQKLKGLLLQHLLFAIVTCGLMWIVGLIHIGGRKRSDAQAPPRYRLALELVTAILVGLTAHLGGYLSGVNLS